MCTAMNWLTRVEVYTRRKTDMAILPKKATGTSMRSNYLQWRQRFVRKKSQSQSDSTSDLSTVIVREKSHITISSYRKNSILNIQL